MSEPRRIVPDNSVMLPAFFEERIQYGGQPFDLSRRAHSLLGAIQSKSVVTFAPEVLLHEFTNKVVEYAWPRAGAPRIDPADAKLQAPAFFRLPITYVPGRRLERHAWTYMTEHRVAPPDSWYLACAVEFDAELWLSHSHADHFAETARSLYAKVYTLTERRFD
jgi:hypothetical protein